MLIHNLVISLQHNHHRHISIVFSLLPPPPHLPVHFHFFHHQQHHISALYLHRHSHQDNHINFSSFPFTTTITTLLLFSHHHHISILYSSPPLPPPHFYCFTGHFITSSIRIQSLILQSCLNVALWRRNILRKNNGNVVLVLVVGNNWILEEQEHSKSKKDLFQPQSADSAL